MLRAVFATLLVWAVPIPFVEAMQGGCSQNALALAIEALTEKSPKIEWPLPRYGIEIEGVVPDKLSYGFFAEKIGESLGGFGYQTKIETQKGVSFVFATRDGVSRQWKVTGDISVLPPNPRTQKDIEVVTPILERPSDFREVETVLEVLKREGFQSEPATGGLHVHVDFGGSTPEELLRMTSVFSLFELEMGQVLGVSRRRRTWIEPTSWIWKEFSMAFAHAKANGNLNPKEFWDFFGSLNESTERRRKLNPLAYRKFGTVEFRIFNSTADPVAIHGMQDFSRKLVRAVRSGDPKLFQYIYQSNGEISFNRVAELIGSEWGNDFENAMRHIQKDVEDALQRNQAEEFAYSMDAESKKKGKVTAWMTLLLVGFAVAGNSNPEERL